jgi:hypothetical protein
MEKGNSQKKADGSALDFEAQLWAAAEQAVPAPNCNRRKRWPCASTPRNADSFRMDLHPDLKADFILAKEALIGAIKKCHQTLWAGGKLSPTAA